MAQTPLGSVQLHPALTDAFYGSTSARCVCGSTITLRTDGQWWHGAGQGIYCRDWSLR